MPPFLINQHLPHVEKQALALGLKVRSEPSPRVELLDDLGRSLGVVPPLPSSPG